jgi:hypothetical protein
MKPIYRFKRLLTIALLATAAAGCEVGAVMDSPQISPDPGLENGSADPKRPVPIKPKRNPDGKIQRPKLVEDLINKIVTRSSVDHNDTLYYEDFE